MKAITNVEIKQYIESTEKLKEEEASLKANNAILIERVEELKGLVKSLECIISEDKKESEKRLKAAQDAKYYKEKGHKNDNPHKGNRGQALQNTIDMVFERSTTYSRKDEDHNKEYYQNQGDNYNKNGNSNENRYDQEFFEGKICKHITLTEKNVSLLKTVDLNISEYASKWQPEMNVHMEQDANSAMI